MPHPPLPHRPTPRRAALQGYKGWFTKPRVLHAWLDKHAATLGDRLVVFIDGSDVMWSNPNPNPNPPPTPTPDPNPDAGAGQGGDDDDERDGR